MKKHKFNDSLQVYEIDPRYLEEGIHAAEKKCFDSIRIISEESNLKCHLDLGPFNDKTFIKKLILGDTFKVLSVKNIDAIYSLVEMIDLTLGLPVNIDFSQLKQLEKLSLHTESYKNLNSLVNLKQLYFSNLKGNCSELRALKELNDLRLDCCKNLISLDGIEELVKLKTCWLVKNLLLNEVDRIAKLTNLEWLHIENCKKLMNYSFLNNNDSIKKLFISDLDSLEFVTNMKKLENINFRNCKNGDLSPLLKCPNLQKIYFYPKKKHYSHQRDEINNMLLEKIKI